MSSSQIGSVAGVFRYPVKSLRGERLRSADADRAGISGDRHWAFRDVARQEIASAKHNTGLLQLSANLEEGDIGHAKIHMPDGAELRTSDPACSERVSNYLGKEVTLHPIHPAVDTDHYARRPIAPQDFERYAREFFALTVDEPLPDLSKLPSEAISFVSMPGTYFDVLPLHIILLSELERLQWELPGSAVAAARFRPNVVLDDRTSPRKSSDLIGMSLQIGLVVANVEMTTPRCAMATHAQEHFPRAPEIMRKLVLGWQHSFGVYASIEQPGTMQQGDLVTLT